MLGTVGRMNNKTGGYIISNTVSSNTTTLKQNFNIPAGAKILCTNCTIDNEATLISNGTIIKIEEGYHFVNEANVAISRSVTNKRPLTILKGREILYSDYAVSGKNVIVNLPRGARINGTAATQNGEVTIGIQFNGLYNIEY